MIMIVHNICYYTKLLKKSYPIIDLYIYCNNNKKDGLQVEFENRSCEKSDRSACESAASVPHPTQTGTVTLSFTKRAFAIQIFRVALFITKSFSIIQKLFSFYSLTNCIPTLYIPCLQDHFESIM